MLISPAEPVKLFTCGSRTPTNGRDDCRRRSTSSGWWAFSEIKRLCMSCAPSIPSRVHCLPPTPGLASSRVALLSPT